MLYTGQLNEFIRLAEIDNTNCDLLKKKTGRFERNLVLDVTKIKGMVTNIVSYYLVLLLTDEVAHENAKHTTTFFVNGMACIHKHPPN
jgi:hypothetical protein